MFDHFHTPQTVNELVSALTKWLGESVWQGLTG